MTVRCPVCRKSAAALAVDPAFPFCSARCRILDLGKWLDGEYRIPGERAGDGAAGPGDGRDDRQVDGPGGPGERPGGQEPGQA